MWDMLMKCSDLSPLLKKNLLDNEFTFKNLEIKLYETRV